VTVDLRADLIKVYGGDNPVAVNKWHIVSEIKLETAKGAVDEYDYAYAHRLLWEIMQYPLNGLLKKKVMRATQRCEIFDLCDKFQHGEACRSMQAANIPWPQYQQARKVVLRETDRASGYEMVGGLFNNAARCAHRHYDDNASPESIA